MRRRSASGAVYRPTPQGATLLLGTVLAGLWSQSVSADCHAKDLDQAQIRAVINEVNEATANLRALQTGSAVGPGAGGPLGVAIQVTDRAAAETALFVGYLQVYERLQLEADRTVTDVAIRVGAKTIWQASQGYADYLTVLANSLPQYAEELRHARDRVRKLTTMLRCAASGSGQGG